MKLQNDEEFNYIDVNELHRLFGLVQSYYERITGKLSFNETEIKEFFLEHLNITRDVSEDFMFKVARALEFNPKDVTLTEEHLTGIGYGQL